MRKTVLLLLTVLLSFSCSHDAFIENETSNERVNNESLKGETLLIDHETESLTLEDAQKVALRFNFLKNPASSRTANYFTLNDLNVTVASDEASGNPLLYIVNKGHNEGYVVVSASKKTHPILIHSDTGHFNPQAELASKGYLEDYKMQIKEAYKDSSDSLRERYALEWAQFEKTDPALLANSRASSDEINKMIQEEIDRKTALGYTYMGKIHMASRYLTPENYQGLLTDISKHTDPDYNYEEVSLFFIKAFENNRIGPLIGTKWHQDKPFNVDAPNKFAGCVPIAVAQIVYYHQYPDKYDWSQISATPDPDFPTNAFKYFIKDIRDLCKVKYNSDGTSSDYKKARDAFRALGYYATDAGLPDFIKLREEMKRKNPVYISGQNPERKKGHAWVCEGYSTSWYEGIISMVIDRKYGSPSTAGSLYFDYEFHANPPTSSSQEDGEAFYMNMGWGGLNNGWYRANSYNRKDPDHSYLKDQKMITVNK